MNFVVRSARSAASLLPEIRRVDPEHRSGAADSDVATMREIIQRSMTLERGRPS